MKANKWQNCFLCPSRGPGRWCWELKAVLDDMDFDKIHPSCPLPDWPSVSKKDIENWIDELWQEAIEKDGAIKFLINQIRSLGIIITEPDKEVPR